MDATMDVDMSFEHVLPQPQLVQLPRQENPSVTSTLPSTALKTEAQTAAVLQQRDNFKDIPVKVHIRRPERDSWVYVGRAMVTLEVSGHSSQVVVRSTSNSKILIRFSEGTELQAEKRGNFVVIGCVEGSKVISWSLNALNNAETIRLLASIELACYRSKQVIGDPRSHHKSRRR
ncbi:hypothetical protein OF83DRAFT_1098364 [Amylostereum chailletii]|nr:hypothetical protein OF83DRAFT_1098364 [Amylostereum chailletii]